MPRASSATPKSKSTLSPGEGNQNNTQYNQINTLDLSTIGVVVGAAVSAAVTAANHNNNANNANTNNKSNTPSNSTSTSKTQNSTQRRRKRIRTMMIGRPYRDKDSMAPSSAPSFIPKRSNKAASERLKTTWPLSVRALREAGGRDERREAEAALALGRVQNDPLLEAEVLAARPRLDEVLRARGQVVA
jgi:hypothetical protein